MFLNFSLNTLHLVVLALASQYKLKTRSLVWPNLITLECLTPLVFRDNRQFHSADYNRRKKTINSRKSTNKILFWTPLTFLVCLIFWKGVKICLFTALRLLFMKGSIKGALTDSAYSTLVLGCLRLKPLTKRGQWMAENHQRMLGGFQQQSRTR